MGTRTGRMVLLLVIVSLALMSLAWAETTSEEAVALPAPEIAQVPAPPVTSTVTPPPAVVTVVPAPETLGITQNTTGTAYYYNDRDWEVWINLGDRNGLRPTAQVEFSRCGVVTGTGCVKNVYYADAVVTPAPGTPAGAIQPGDDVRVCVNGTRAALEDQLAKERRLHLFGEIFFTTLIWYTSL